MLECSMTEVRKGNLRYVQIHGFIIFLTSVLILEARSATFDLDTATGFSLDVFDVFASSTDNLST